MYCARAHTHARARARAHTHTHTVRYERVEDADNEREQARIVHQLTGKVDAARAAVKTGLNIPAADLEQLMGPAAAAEAARLLAPWQGGGDARVAAADRELLASSESTSDSSAEDKADVCTEHAQRRLLDTAEQSLLLYQRFFERMPAQFKHRDETRLYEDLPQVRFARLPGSFLSRPRCLQRPCRAPHVRARAACMTETRCCDEWRQGLANVRAQRRRLLADRDDSLDDDVNA